MTDPIQQASAFDVFYLIADDIRFKQRLSDDTKRDIAILLDNKYRHSQSTIDMVKHAYCEAVTVWLQLKDGERLTSDILGEPIKPVLGINPHVPGTGMVTEFVSFISMKVSHCLENHAIPEQKLDL